MALLDSTVVKGNIEVTDSISCAGKVISDYITVAPTSANTTGKIQIVVLTSEPATKYSGYIYLII